MVGTNELNLQSINEECTYLLLMLEKIKWDRKETDLIVDGLLKLIKNEWRSQNNIFYFIFKT